MSDYLQICLYYAKGMCVYCNHKAAIFEPCHFENFSEEFKTEYMKNCLQKKAIESIKQRENNLEEKTEKHANLVFRR